MKEQTLPMCVTHAVLLCETSAVAQVFSDESWTERKDVKAHVSMWRCDYAHVWSVVGF